MSASQLVVDMRDVGGGGEVARRRGVGGTGKLGGVGLEEWMEDEERMGRVVLKVGMGPVSPEEKSMAWSPSCGSECARFAMEC